MRVLIIGGGGMVGRKLAERLAADGSLNGRVIDHLTLYDIMPPHAPANAPFGVDCIGGDLADPGEAERLVTHHPSVIFHLAAIVSGEAELEFDKGWRINMDGTRALLEAVRHAYDPGKAPRVVFTSSIAVFGAPLPDPIGDDFFHTPLTSYGAQKACSELMLADYSRKGFCDGIGIRLPTIVVRPGKPNKAASGFFSGIIREPLAGMEAVCPVDAGVKHWMASPRSAVGFLIHAAGLDGAAVGTRRNLTMPGLAAKVGEMVAALEKVAGKAVAGRIRWERDPFIETIVAGWPQAFDARRATELGFRAEATFEDIIRAHIDDELGGKIA